MRLVLDARTAAFAALIDCAGLFPPAELSMASAVNEYMAIRGSDRAWVAGRFLCSASRLEELASVATRTFTAGEPPWEIGVIFDLPTGESSALATDFNTEMDPVMSVSAVEARLGSASQEAIDSLLDAMLSIGESVVPFVEIRRETSITSQIDLIADSLASRRRVGGAKIRCGGLTPESFPSPAEVAEFIFATTNRGLPFKATAGLHQPIRHFDDGIGMERHGFVNILLAAALADAGLDQGGITEVVADTDESEFSVSTIFASWRGHEVPGSALRRVRKDRFVAYGSCDFDEPVTALEDLEFLGGGS